MHAKAISFELSFLKLKQQPRITQFHETPKSMLMWQLEII